MPFSLPSKDCSRSTIENVPRPNKNAPRGNHPPATATPRYNVYDAKCPTRQALDRIADKWTALIVGLLEQRVHRFGELKRAVDGISHKVLTQTLRSLEADGLVARRVLQTKPVTVEYSLTPLGRTLAAPLAAIRDWAEQHIVAVQASRARTLKTSAPGSVARVTGR